MPALSLPLRNVSIFTVALVVTSLISIEACSSKEARLRQIRQDAEQGDADAQVLFSLMYAEGWGVPQDDREAAKWLRKVADQGDAQAQGDLGMRYYEGLGVPQDYCEALKWWRKAADHGERFSQDRLGLMYYEGQGVPQDLVKAHAWFTVAAAGAKEFNEHAVAISRKDLEERMAATQILKAQQLAAQLHKRIEARKR